jgi:proline dehydrogenase
MNSIHDKLIECIPTSIVAFLTSPYLAGQDASAAVQLAHSLFKLHRFTATLDILGENFNSLESCIRAVDSYKNLVDSIYKSPLSVKHSLEQISISCKTSMFSIKSPQDRNFHSSYLDDAYMRIESVVDYAASFGINITLEAEDRHWTDFHLDTYFALIQKGYRNLGTVLQSRLFRTKSDIKRFNAHTRVRLVIGIYNEPSEYAYTHKPTMKNLLIDYAAQLLEQGAYVEFATHDVQCLHNFVKEVLIPKCIPQSQFEFQFLKGVPRQKLQLSLVSGEYFKKWSAPDKNSAYIQQLSNSGALVRLYLPFGMPEVASSYCKRRLQENPNIIVYGLNNLIHRE